MRPRVEDEVQALKAAFADHLRHSLVKDRYTATDRDRFSSLALAIRDRLIDQWIQTQQTYYDSDAKRVYYLSLEFMPGRALLNSLLNLDLLEAARQSMAAVGCDLSELCEQESEPGLGNGGLGRLAACFMDSMATLQLPAYGYGLRYEYGIFFQRIFDGFQVEAPDNWLRYGNPWEVPRPEFLYPVPLYGRVEEYIDEQGRWRKRWVDTQRVMAMAYDTPVPGYGCDTVNTLRLWSAKSSREFSLEHFNYGDYERAVEDKNRTETITRILYPNDQFFVGLELRLKQQFFLVCATLQDVMRRHRKFHESLESFADKQVVQLNDTHPAIAIAELMRVLVDDEAVDWNTAWEITVATFSYTNHTVLPEALEKWPVSLMASVLPRHLEIIHEINSRFLSAVSRRYPGDQERRQRMSLLEEGADSKVRMAHLAVVGSHSTNGVSRLHTNILKDEVFRDFDELWPQRFNSKTNGISHRRWLLQSNPALAGLISARIGPEWASDPDQLERLRPLVSDAAFRQEWRAAKRSSKAALSDYIAAVNNVRVDPEALFDCHVKRLHEYKRQLMNLLHVITRYNRIKDDPLADAVPRVVIFAGKAAPAYYAAKLVIKLIHDVAYVVNQDAEVGDRLKVVFLANYGVSLAERIFPATDLSQQISTAGMEASGTGNMKFALNGALTIGTRDGANPEMAERVGEDDIYLFGLTAAEVRATLDAGHKGGRWYEEDDELRRAVDMIANGYFNRVRPELYGPLVGSLLNDDPYLVMADYRAYVNCQDRVCVDYQDRDAWAGRSIVNCAAMGYFSSDRTIREYASEIWDVGAVPAGSSLAG